ncbi:MAG: 16S rRNA (uracil(1498)-N(3))-methyltransferase [Alphaproteobacteria bacterium]|nr:MAG: 16S rRNA (uracil(1498)-N(3))-methyltransferase [Alphaproteobacteria bacterium]
MKVRLYVHHDLSEGASLPLGETHDHYLRHVLRRQLNDTVFLFNGRDGEWQSHIHSLDKKGGALLVESRAREQSVAVPLGLAFALIKRSPCEWMIEKASELGVTELWPLTMQRSAVHDANIARLQAIATESAEQCGRLDVPVVHPVQSLEKFLKTAPTGQSIFFAAESGQARPLRDVMNMQPALFLIGPEGGFSEQEHVLLRRIDQVIPISLGRNILRAETAALTCLALRCCGDDGIKIK